MQAKHNKSLGLVAVQKWAILRNYLNSELAIQNEGKFRPLFVSLFQKFHLKIKIL